MADDGTSRAPAGPDNRFAKDDYLPDFCSTDILLNVAVLGLLMAVVFTLLTRTFSDALVQGFVLIAIFIEWLALSCVAILCKARPWLLRLPQSQGLMLTFLIIPVVTLVIGEIGIRVLNFTAWLPTANPQWKLYFHAQNFIVSSIIGVVTVRFFISRHQLQQTAVDATLSEQELQRYRIRRHFVHNSLNTIAALTSYKPEEVESAVEDTADLIRHMLNDTRDLVRVSQEIDLVEKFLRMEGLRLQERLQIEWREKSFPFSARTPPLMLELLLEHAIQYGIEPSETGGVVSIALTKAGENLEIKVCFPADTLREEDQQSPILDNISARLRLHYGDAAALTSRIHDASTAADEAAGADADSTSVLRGDSRSRRKKSRKKKPVKNCCVNITHPLADTSSNRL